MKAKRQYNLNDFDLLVAKASFLFEKRRAVEKEQAEVMDDITQLLLANNLTQLRTTCGQMVRIQKTLSTPISSLPPAEKDELYQWCKAHDLVSINHHMLLSYLNEGGVAPIKLNNTRLRAKFITPGKPVSVSVNVRKEIENSVKNTTPEARKAHMKDLRDAGLTFLQIAMIYGISSTHVSRILKKKDDIQKVRNGSVIINL